LRGESQEVMKTHHWLFRKLNLSLRLEVIVNISVLMMVAILLIGFTIAKTNENAIIQERIRSSEDMVKDFQAILDFMARGNREFSLGNAAVRKEIQAFIDIYVRGKGFYDVMVFDQAMKPVGGKRTEPPDRPYDRDRLKKAVASGLLSTDIDKAGGFLSPEYRKLKLYAPLWSQGKVAGAVRMEVPLGDVMIHLLRSQRIILLSIVVDAAILIVFGSFLLSRVLVKPLKGLVKLTQKISEGDFNETIESSSANEIGQLIYSFNRMIDRLRENQEDLDEHVKSLEETNKQLKQAHEELIRTEKLATVGRFAAGVAHEVGNPLGAILGYVSMLEIEGTGAEDSKDYLKRIEKEIERINHIVRELLDFSRPSKGEIRDVEVNGILENTLSLLSYQKNFKNIDTRLELDPELPRVQGDESQLSQVFMNIILNALDAMPAGGILGIQTRIYTVESPLRERFLEASAPRRKNDPVESDYSHLRKPNPLAAALVKFSRGERLVKVRISDTGNGIRKEDLEIIFDPFFTTKPPDKGTGLGLSICLRIVESMGGVLRVESEFGKGSAFEVYLPVQGGPVKGAQIHS